MTLSGDERYPPAEFSTYGDFRRAEATFNEIFPEFKQDQCDAASKIVENVLRHCNGKGDFPKIDTIVDFGCGDGALLCEIRRLLLKAKVEMRYVGVDSCRELIETAKARHQPIDFNAVEPGDLLTLGRSMSEPDWSSTAVLCLSHTWFHVLNQERLVHQVNEKRPALLVVDVYETWDRVIGKLQKLYETSSGGAVHRNAISDDVFRLADQCVYSLRTVYQRDNDKNRDEVFRGIYKRDFAPGGTNGWVFYTRQRALTTESLRPTFKDTKATKDNAADILADARTKGTLTGECNYLVLREFSHRSGWGNMHCMVFAALSREAQRRNDAFHAAVRALVHNVFVSKDESRRYWKLRKLVSTFGRGEIAIILPFDPLRAFARMERLWRIKPPSDAATPEERQTIEAAEACERCDIVLELPNHVQRRFPTAYGLYNSLLGQVSSPMAFTLEQAAGYQTDVIDEAFDHLEKCLLEPPSAPDDDGDAVPPQYGGFFVIPFYFGSLPLFALLLETPVQFPVDATDAQVYHAIARNLDRQLHVAIHDKDIQSRVVAPFIAKLLGNTVPSQLQREKELLGTAWEEALMGTGKRWKSWIWALPATPIAELESMRVVYNRLAQQLFDQELKRAQERMPEQIAIWFHSERFFSGKSHDRFENKREVTLEDRRVHLEGLLRDIGLHSPSPSSDVVAYATAAHDALLGSPYFATATAVDNSWRGFLAHELQPLIIAAYQTPGESNEKSLKSAERAFALLKIAFCRAEGNEAPRFRWGFARILLAAVVESMTAVASFNWNEGITNDLLDRCVRLANQQHSVCAFISGVGLDDGVARVFADSFRLLARQGLSRVSHALTSIEYGCRFEAHLYTQRVLQNSGGADFHTLKEHCDPATRKAIEEGVPRQHWLLTIEVIGRALGKFDAKFTVSGLE